jgi:uncharacterized tellurite resistance protein B-like protein
MIDIVKKFFSAQTTATGEAAGTGEEAHHDVLVATCALFLEMAEVDRIFDARECDEIIGLLKAQYGLSDEHAVELARLAHEEREGSHDLWRFTNLINTNYSQDEKIQVVELLWRLVYADGHLSEHEQYLVTKLRKMLRMTHREVIDAKLRVLHEHRSQE